MSTFLLKIMMTVLLGPLTSFAKAALGNAIKEWYKTCLETPSPTDDSIAEALASVLGIDLSPVKDEYKEKLGFDEDMVNNAKLMKDLLKDHPITKIAH